MFGKTREHEVRKPLMGGRLGSSGLANEMTGEIKQRSADWVGKFRIEWKGVCWLHMLSITY